MRSSLVLALVVGVSVPTFAQTMYRCGNSFSQVPCGPEAKTVPVPAPAMDTKNGYLDSPELRKLRQNMEAAQKNFDQVVANHCDGKKFDGLAIGMSEADMYCIPKYRNPAKVNTTVSAGGESKQFVFRDHGRPTYVYFTNGTLSTIQSE